MASAIADPGTGELPRTVGSFSVSDMVQSTGLEQNFCDDGRDTRVVTTLEDPSPKRGSFETKGQEVPSSMRLTSSPSVRQAFARLHHSAAAVQEDESQQSLKQQRETFSVACPLPGEQPRPLGAYSVVDMVQSTGLEQNFCDDGRDNHVVTTLKELHPGRNLFESKAEEIAYGVRHDAHLHYSPLVMGSAGALRLDNDHRGGAPWRMPGRQPGSGPHTEMKMSLDMNSPGMEVL